MQNDHSPMSESSVLPYRQAELPVSVRVADLLGRMTLPEKIAQLVGRWTGAVMNAKSHGTSLEACRACMPHGMGQIARPAVCSGPVGLDGGQLQPRELARALNTLQRYLVEETRLGIPALIHEESLSGATMRGATMFPQALNYASTWNPELMESVADTIRGHLYAVGLRQGLSPLLDVCRDPRWGRTEETFGEDPYLVAAIGCAYVKGLQTDDLRRGVAATAKHFIAYGIPEGGHNVGSVRVGPRELREVFALPFAAAIRRHGLASVMHAYHEIDGVPVVASRELLTDFLRGELGFDGVVVSDYGALWMLFDAHKVAADRAAAAQLALYAGLDMEIPDGWAYESSLADLVATGRIPVSLIDQAVERVLTLKFRLGLFDQPYVDEEAVRDDGFDTPASRTLARRAAAESLVLLKNTAATLPLAAPRRIAVIGPNADAVGALLGDYTYAHNTKLAQPFPHTPTVLDALRAQAPAGCEILHARGCELGGDDCGGFAAAVAAASQADVVVAVMGETANVWSGENHDRTSLSLPGVQEALLRALKATGKPVVLVLLCGRPLSTLAVEDCCDAIMQAWYPGEEGGVAIADLLFGRSEPCGRLPISVPRDAGHIPCHYNRRPFSAAGGSIDAGGPIRPLYPFGHGLTYTTFSYANLRITPTSVLPTESVTISAEISNSGGRAGTETVQLYLRDPQASTSRPVLELKGFARVSLQPGETSSVTFELPLELLAFHDPNMVLQIEPGTVEVKLGASAADCRLAGTFEITGTPLRLPRRSVFFSTARITHLGRRQDHTPAAATVAAGGTAESITAFVEIASRPPAAPGMELQQ